VCEDEAVTADQPSPTSGTVMFLFTDVEGSTRLWAEDIDAMASSLRVHDEVVRSVIERHRGYVFATAGDSFCAAFGRASDAVAAATSAQAELADAGWPGPRLTVRIGLHLGEAEERGGDYFGPGVNTAARVEAAGHGGQVLLSGTVRDAAGVAATDLGSHRLRDVPEKLQLFQLGDREFPPLRVVSDDLVRLPVPSTPLVGREDEIRTIRELLLTYRLVTLAGVGGAGKTRLAIEVAERELPNLEHGAYFADLATVSDREEVAEAVAAAMGLRLDNDDPAERVCRFLAPRRALLVLDNCEHVIDTVADLVEAVLAVPGPGRIVATSRELLDIAGERVFQVPSLQSDDGSSAAVRLFVDRAEAAGAAGLTDETTRRVIAQLCAELDGMPLAIELAAARAAVMSPAQLLERIDDRFTLLSGGRVAAGNAAERWKRPLTGATTFSTTTRSTPFASAVCSPVISTFRRPRRWPRSRSPQCWISSTRCRPSHC
jgi:class 3 adenylate cyclase